MNITAVVVLYQLRPDQSPTIATLARSYQRIRGSGAGVYLIIFDNSPKPQQVDIPLPFEHRYVHDATNGGLAQAYNFALDSDPGSASQWLLLLDQDSTLPDDFLEEVFKALALIGQDDLVAAAVPKVLQHGRPISPALVKGGRIRPIPKPITGVCPFPVTAINAGTLIRKNFLYAIGGFNRQFKLDYLDHWLFAEIKRRGKKVYITGAVSNHDLSIGNTNHPVSAERYLSILKAETLFYMAYSDGGNYLCHLFNLAFRAGRQYLLGQAEFSRLTVRHFLGTINNRWNS
jgi:GT2 family glycosyltransferase